MIILGPFRWGVHNGEVPLTEGWINVAWRREFPAHFLFWLPHHIQLLNSLLCDINLFLPPYHHRCIAVYASHIKQKVSLGLGAGGMQKHRRENPGNMCQGLTGPLEAAPEAVWCSRSVSLPTALWFVIKPSPNGMEGRTGLLSAHRWDNSGHLCSDALQTAPCEAHHHCLRCEASQVRARSRRVHRALVYILKWT